MRRFAIAFLVGVIAAVPVALAPGFAQTPMPQTGTPSAVPPAAPPSAAPPTAAVTPTTPMPTIATPPDARQTAKGVRATCRDSAKSEGLKGDAMRKAVSDCVVKVRPDLAAKEQCRMDGFAKGLRKDELKSFVKDCAKGKG